MLRIPNNIIQCKHPGKTYHWGHCTVIITIVMDQLYNTV